MNKKKLLFIILGIVLVIILILYFTGKKDISEKLNNYLLKNDFYNTENMYVLEKQISILNEEEFKENVSNNIDSEYDLLFFNTYSFELYRDYRNLFDNVTISFLPRYNYVSEELTYIYRITSGNSNTIISGSYNDNNFVCDVTFSSEEGINNIKNDICNSIEYEIKDFKYTASALINSPSLISEMKKNNRME